MKVGITYAKMYDILEILAKQVGYKSKLLSDQREKRSAISHRVYNINKQTKNYQFSGNGSLDIPSIKLQANQGEPFAIVDYVFIDFLDKYTMQLFSYSATQKKLKVEQSGTQKKQLHGEGMNESCKIFSSLPQR